MAWLAFGRYGKVKLGDGEPVFSTLSWVAMLFSAGVGGSLLYWSVIEWAAYYTAPPFGAEPKSTNALEWATSYGMFHWGITAWCIYALPTIAISYSFYVRKIPYLRLSAAILGEKSNTSIWAKVIDFSFMIALIGGAGTSLSLTAPVISAGFSHLTGVERTPTVDLMVICLCIAIFGTSVYMGLEKGIKKLADANFYLSIILLLFVLIVGPTTFILMMGTESIGFMLANTIEMLTWTDAVDNTGFVQDYTIFYWAWWLALGPQVGLFVARISKGRTLRELIMGMLIIGSFGCFIFFSIIGNYAINLELNNQLMVSEILANDGHQIAATSILMQLPFGEFFVLAYCLIVIIFIVTSYDSVSYILSYHVKSTASEAYEPSKNMRLFWALVLAILPACLFLIGSNRTAMDLILLMSPPLLFLSPIFVISMIKTLRSHYASEDSSIENNLQ